MKYQKVNLEIIAEAIYEFENSTQPYGQVCDKFGIERTSFYYHLRKHRMNQKGGSHIYSLNANSTNKNPSTSAFSTETPSNSDKLVYINTNNRKMTQYMTQHNMRRGDSARIPKRRDQQNKI